MRTTRLVYRPIPREKEGLFGFLLRTSEGNALPGIQAAFRGENTIEEGVIRMRLGWEADVAHVARLLQELASPGYGIYKVWNRQTSRFCPTCLKQAGYWHQIWELSLVTVCPEHQCELVDACHQCGRPFDWNRSRLHRCNCGARLHDSSAGKASDTELTLTRLLHHCLMGCKGMPEHLVPLQLPQLHRLAVVLGAHADPVERSFPLKIPHFPTLETARRIAHYAAEALFDWPNGFHRLLHQLQDRRQGRPTGSNRFTGQFGFFYSTLFKQFCQSEFSAVIGAFESYIAENWPHPLANRNKLLSAGLRRNHVWIPASEAAKTLDASQSQLATLYEAGRIAGQIRTTDRGRRLFYVDRRQLPQIAASLKDRVDLQAAARLLGLQKARLSHLIGHSELGPALAPDGNRRSRWSLSSAFIQSLLTLGSNLPQSDEELSPTGVTLVEGLRHILHGRELFPELVLSVMNGELQPTALDKNREGIAAWTFDRADLFRWRARTLERLRGERVTIPAAARRLGLRQETMYQLVNKGLLLCALDLLPEGRWIMTDELDRFRETYALGSEIAAELQTSPTRVTRLLQQFGIRAVCGPCVDGSRQYIYQRTPELKAVMARLASAITAFNKARNENPQYCVRVGPA